MNNKLLIGLTAFMSFSMIGCNEDNELSSSSISSEEVENSSSKDYSNEKLFTPKFDKYNKISFNTSAVITNYKIYETTDCKWSTKTW